MKSLLPFLIIGISAGMYFVYISPTMVEITDLRAKKTEYISVLEQAKEIKTRRDSLVASYDSISAENIEKLHKIIPTKFNSVLLANDINSIATKYGIAIKDFRSSTPDASRTEESGETPKNLYKTSTVTVTIDGTYEQFLKFLGDIELSLQLMDVSMLSIKSSQTAPGTPGNQKQVLDNSLHYIVELHLYSLQ